MTFAYRFCHRSMHIKLQCCFRTIFNIAQWSIAALCVNIYFTLRTSIFNCWRWSITALCTNVFVRYFILRTFIFGCWRWSIAALCTNVFVKYFVATMVVYLNNLKVVIVQIYIFLKYLVLTKFRWDL